MKSDRESCRSFSSQSSHHADYRVIGLTSNREKMKISPTVVDELVRGANSDIRLVLNMLSTYKLRDSEMDFDQGKELYVEFGQGVASPSRGLRNKDVDG